VSFWAEVSLGVIALATLTMALVQVSVIVYGWMLARRISRLVGQIEQEMKPLADSLNAMARDAARATALAASQVERVDKMFTELTTKIEHTASTIQKSVLSPLRDGAAVMTGIRTAIEVFRELARSRSARGRNEEEDALFIG
jgi:predicted PurR-regulated permease PerM